MLKEQRTRRTPALGFFFLVLNLLNILIHIHCFFHLIFHGDNGFPFKFSSIIIVNADSCSSFIPSFILLYLGTAGLHGNNIFRLFLEGHFGIHLEVASDSFCFLINSSWLLVFILYVFSLFFLGFNLYCLKGIHFS